MWSPYVELAKIYFPNVQIVIDRYHFVRQTAWAIENVRKRLQRSMSVSLRKYYKRSRSLILAYYSTLKDKNKKKYAETSGIPEFKNEYLMGFEDLNVLESGFFL